MKTIFNNPSEYIGTRSGSIVITDIVQKDANGGSQMCVCKCDCGNEIVCKMADVVSGKRKHCSRRCPISIEKIASLNRVDLAGQRFGRLTAIEPTDLRSGNNICWKCKCDCGRIKIVSANHLMAGKIKSCGECGYLLSRIKDTRFRKYSTDMERHVAKILNGMKFRCYNTNSAEYSRYGGRGITICDEWLNDAKTFVDWAISNGYREDLTIDRIDNNGPYSPDNCRWVSHTVQQNNKSSNHLITIDDITHTVSQWSRLILEPPRKITHLIRDKGNDGMVSYVKGALNEKRLHVSNIRTSLDAFAEDFFKRMK